MEFLLSMMQIVRHFKIYPLFFVRIQIHRAVLTAASKYFSAALGANFLEGSKSEFVLEDTDGETIRAIVDFCYTGRIVLTEESVDKFMAIASSVEVDLLEKQCCRYYADRLSVMNLVDTLMIADKYGNAELHQRALDFVCGAFEMVPTTEIQKLEYRLLFEILKCDKIQANEELVFNRLLEWFQREEGTRSMNIPLQVSSNKRFYWQFL